jgi:hypothetical protein
VNNLCIKHALAIMILSHWVSGEGARVLCFPRVGENRV